jgi:hypothetical protein
MESRKSADREKKIVVSLSPLLLFDLCGKFNRCRKPHAVAVVGLIFVASSIVAASRVLWLSLNI